MKIFLKTVLLLALLASGTIVAQTAKTSKTEYVSLSGRKIAYRSIGKGDPIILVNRFRGTLDTWDPLFLDNLAKKHMVVTFDYAGIGYSSGKLPTDINQVAKDVKELADALKIKKAVIMGWSYGGLVAQIVTINHPELATKTILLGTGPVGKRDVALEPAFLNAALKPVNDINDEIVLFFEPESEFSKARAKASHDRISQRIDVSKVPATMEIFQLYFKGTEPFDEDKSGYREKLLNIKTPILVVSGDHDISFAVEMWYPLTKKLHSTQLIVLPETGHAPHHQYPDLVTEYIESFLKETK